MIFTTRGRSIQVLTGIEPRLPGNGGVVLRRSPTFSETTQHPAEVGTLANRDEPMHGCRATVGRRGSTPQARRKRNPNTAPRRNISACGDGPYPPQPAWRAE